MISNTDIGKNYEQIAVKYLKGLGYKIIEQNYRLLPIGEIDIIVKDKKTLVFVEVKFRQNKDYGNPSEFVNKSKQLKITKTALYYIKINSVKSDIRFDVISICNDDIEHIKNAFCVDNKNYYF
ncbi:MAG: YraN family protein [Endomicrobiaceae bacterium]|nr:YraN family protein [Endomicrobiaceae bacterium]